MRNSWFKYIFIIFVIGIIVASTTAYAANILFVSVDLGYENTNTDFKTVMEMVLGTCKQQ